MPGRHLRIEVAAFLLATCVAVSGHAESSVNASAVSEASQADSSTGVLEPASLALDVARGHAERLALLGRVESARLEAGRAQSSPRFMTIEGVKGVQPFAIYAWIIPESGAPKRAVAEFVAELMTREAGALNHQLTVATPVATRVEKWFGGQKVALFSLEISARLSGNLDCIEQHLDTLLNRWRYEGLNSEERQLAEQRGIHLDDIRALLTNELSNARRTTIEVYPGAAPHFANPNSTDKEAKEGDTDLKTAPNAPDKALDEAPRKNGALVSVKTAKQLRMTTKTSDEKLAKRAPDAKPKRSTSREAPGAHKPRAKPLRRHIVKKGESLLGIATRYDVRLEALVRANQLGSKRVIVPGQALTIPVQAP